MNKLAVFGAGCFWHVQEEFDKVRGIVKSIVGYAGGKTENPTYKTVKTHTTGHAETIEIEFNPEEISYVELLEKLFEIHDPTSLNKQGNDLGPNYRSIILYADEEQKKQAKKFVKEKQADYDKPIVTEIVKLKTFWPAEDDHQKYFARMS